MKRGSHEGTSNESGEWSTDNRQERRKQKKLRKLMLVCVTLWLYDMIICNIVEEARVQDKYW